MSSRAKYVLTVVVTAIVVGTLSYFVGTGDLGGVTSQESTRTPSENVPNNSTETVTDLVLLKSKSSQKPDHYSLSITAPKSWRTIEARRILENDKNFFGTFVTDSLDAVAYLRFVPDGASADNLFGPLLQPTNSINTYDVTDWMATSSTDGLSTSSERKAYISYVEGLSKSTDLTSTTGCAPYTRENVISSYLCDDKRVEPRSIATADGNFHGIAYLTMQHQAASYDPQANIFLTATVGGRTLLMQGIFKFFDNTFYRLSDPNDLEAIVKARNAYLSDSLLPDTERFYENIISAVSSIKFELKTDLPI